MAMFNRSDAPYLRTYAQEAAMVDASELIADALQKSGLTQSELARELQVSKSEITARLAGERNITVRKLADTLHALGQKLVLKAVPEAERSTTNTARGQVVDFERYVAQMANRRSHRTHSSGRRLSVNEVQRAMMG